MRGVRELLGAVTLLIVGASAYLFRAEVAWLGERTLRLVERTQFPLETSASVMADRYRTAPVRRGDILKTVTSTGTINAVVTVEVGTQLSGQLAKILVDFNDEVEKGQPLAELDRRSFEARLAEARAALEVAQTLVAVQEFKIERAYVDGRDAQARSAVMQARLDTAKARHKAAENAFRRLETLHIRGVSSPTQVEQAQTDRDAAAANVREAEALAAAHVQVVAAAEVDLHKAHAERANAYASVLQAEAVQLHAKIDLERTIIRSPINGVIVGRNVSEGQTVASSLEAPTLFMIAGDLEHMDIHARVDESDIGKIKVGQKATFTVDAHPERSFVAQVAAVRKAPQAAQQSGSGMRRAPQTPSNVVTYTVVLRTSNSDGLLLPGMTALVRIVIEEAKDVLMVPMSAFRFAPRSEERRVSAGQRPGRNNELVWVWDDGRGVRPVSVEVGTTDGVHAGVVNSAVPNGLRDGDQVVVAEAGDAAPKRLLGVKFGF